MSGPFKVIVLDPDPRAGRLVQLGFEREGVGASLADPAGGALDLPPEAGAILVGGTHGAAVDLVRRARHALEKANIDIPIISAGRGASRAELEAAGANEVLARPTFLRDVVTVCRILHGVPAQKRDRLVGNLAETTGVYTLVRALGALGRSAVLTLIRGLRRGEVRFYKGEVTSAEVGVIHGQAALHQLLLWTDARFDFSHEDIVRRAQIPLSAEELFADAERFLEGVRDAAGNLSPATVLEQDIQRIHDLGKHIPTEVYGVLRMFDGHRVLSDVLEDSPYRVFETLRVAQKAVEVGLLRRVESQRKKSTWRAVLAIDEWLVGNETRDSVVERTADIDSGPTKQHRKSRSKKSRAKRTNTPPAGTKAEIDWGALVPRVIGAEVGPLSGVVPSLAAHGEVELPATRDRAREKLEALMDTGKRDRIFPTEVGMEPKVVIAGMGPDAAIPQPAEPETVGSGPKRKKKKEAERVAAEKRAADQARATAERVEAERIAKERIAAEMAKIEAERVANEQARLEEQRVGAERAASSRAEAERVAKERIAAEMAKIEAERVANEKARFEEQRLEAERVAKERIAAEMAKLDAERVATEKARLEEQRIEAERSAAASRVKPADLASDTIRDVGGGAPYRDVASSTGATPTDDLAGDTLRGVGVIDAAHVTTTSPTTDARDLVRRLVAEAIPPTGPAPSAPSSTSAADAGLTATPSTASTSAAAAGLTATPISESVPGHAASGATTLPVRNDDGDALTKPFIRADAHVTPPITVSEGERMTVAISDVVTVTGSVDTAVVTASPRVLITETPAITVSGARDDATPIATDDEPSDGVIRSAIATANTARVAARARAMRPTEPEFDGPLIKEATGEIGDRRVRTGVHERLTSEPSIAVEPSLLVSDLGAAHDAVSAAIAKPMPAAPPADMASASKELEISAVRRDAVDLSDEEEEFFKRAESGTGHVPKLDSFDDLDEDYQPPTFWDRVFGRNNKNPR